MRFRARRRVVGAILLAMVLLGPLWPTPGVRAGSPEPLSLRVQTPAFTLDEQGVQVAGYAWNDAPGAPRLPVYGAVMELPGEGNWSIAHESPASRILDRLVDVRSVAVVLAPEPGPRSTAMDGAEPDRFIETDRPDPAIYGVDAFYPASPVVTGEIQWQRGRRLLAVRVFPFQYNPVTRELRYHPDVRITVSVEPGVTAAAQKAPHTAATSARAMPSAAPRAAGVGALRIYTAERGMHRVAYADLVAAGAPVTEIDPASLQMSNRGNPVRIQVNDAGNGTFDDGDEVLFYAEPIESRYSAQNIYWLTYGPTPAPPEARMETRTAPTAAGDPLTAIWQTVRAEVNASYFGDYPIETDIDHWFDTALDTASADPASRSYNLTLDDALPSGVVQFRGLFYGGKDQADFDPDQSILVRLNGHDVQTFQWEGRTAHPASAGSEASYLDTAEGATNQVVLTASKSQFAAAVGDYWVYPDWIELQYPALADADGTDRIFIEGLPEAAGESAHVAVAGFTEPADAVRVYDVRNPGQPVQLGTVEAEGEAAPYTIHFWDAWTAGAPESSYYLTTAGALRTPAAIQLDAPSNWRDPHDADYIAIVHSSLRDLTDPLHPIDPIDPLLAWRASQGLRVVKVDVQDIYDEFSHGFVYPPAIRDFLKNAYETWNPGDEPPKPPHYVLLVGDGHYDFKGYSAEGRALPNLIPPYLIDIDPFIGETAADNRFVTFDGPDDILPEMALGRVPARTVADVTAVVDKVAAYEDPSDPDYAPDGAWQSRVTYVAGNNADAAGAFQDLSDAARLNLLPDQFDDRTLYWLKDYTDYALLRTATKEATGTSVMLQWFGHASRFAWFADNYDFFGIGSVANMTDTTQWPFTVDYSCWTGYFVNLYNRYQALGETMLNYPKRGSIATLAPSGKHLGAALLTLQQGITTAIFRDRIREVGDAVDAARLYFFTNSGGYNLDVIDTEILFGDPALRLRLPSQPPTPPSIDSVEIVAGGSYVSLAWPHELDSAAYELWRATSPYFTPDLDAGEGVLVDTVPAGFVSRGATLTVEDDGEPPTPPVTLIGDPETNYFWVLRSINGDGVSAPSQHVGEFDFSLTPGG